MFDFSSALSTLPTSQNYAGKRSFYLPPIGPTGRARNSNFLPAFQQRSQAMQGAGQTEAPQVPLLGGPLNLPQPGQGEQSNDPMALYQGVKGLSKLGGLFGPSNSQAIAGMGLTSSIAPEVGTFGAAGFAGGGYGGATLGTGAMFGGAGAGLDLGAGTALTASIPAGAEVLAGSGAGAAAAGAGAEGGLMAAGAIGAPETMGLSLVAAAAIYGLGKLFKWF